MNITMEKSAIITGASRGIGRAAALELAKHGYRVLVCYRRSSDDAADVCRRISSEGGTALPFQMDVGDLADCRRTVSKAMLEFGRVDVLVNNAGILGIWKARASSTSPSLCSRSTSSWYTS